MKLGKRLYNLSTRSLSDNMNNMDDDSDDYLQIFRFRQINGLGGRLFWRKKDDGSSSSSLVQILSFLHIDNMTSSSNNILRYHPQILFFLRINNMTSSSDNILRYHPQILFFLLIDNMTLSSDIILRYHPQILFSLVQI